MTFPDNGTINWHCIPGWILWSSDRWQTHLPMLVNQPAEYPEPDQDDASSEALLPEQENNENALSSASPPQKAVQYCSIPGQVRHLKGSPTKYLVDHMDLFHRYAEMVYEQCVEMQLTFQDAQNPSVFITTPKVGGIGLNCTAANHAVITQKVWVLNEQWQGLARVLQLAQTRVPQTWLRNMCIYGYGDRTSDLHQHSGAVQERVLQGVIRWLNITAWMMCWLLASCEAHMNWLTEHGDMSQCDDPSS